LIDPSDGKLIGRCPEFTATDTEAAIQAAAAAFPKFRTTLARERARMLDDCTVLRIREIRKQTLKIAAEALVVNSGAWVVLFFAPWIIASIGYSEAKMRFSVLASLNSREFRRISPVESAAAAVI